MGESENSSGSWIVVAAGSIWTAYSLMMNPRISGIVPAVIQGVFCVATCGAVAVVCKWITGRWKAAFVVTFLAIVALYVYLEATGRVKPTPPAAVVFNTRDLAG